MHAGPSARPRPAFPLPERDPTPTHPAVGSPVRRSRPLGAPLSDPTSSSKDVLVSEGEAPTMSASSTQVPTGRPAHTSTVRAADAHRGGGA